MQEVNPPASGPGRGVKVAAVNHIKAVVVTYHPNREALSNLLDAIAGQVETVVVVDNASPVDLRKWLLDAGNSRECELLLLDQNLGVAAAHNLGIHRARALGADAVLLLDQDSLPAPDMVAALRAALRSLTEAGESIAAVGPYHVDRRTQEPSPFVRFGILFNRHLYCTGTSSKACIQCDHLITSGTLIPTLALDYVGGLDEGLFVDAVDTEWCFRAISRGCKLYGVCSAHMGHALGEGRVKTWIPFSDDVVVHRPTRLYYIVRNHILLYRRGYTPPRWILQDLPRLLFKAGVFGTTISPRLTNLSMMLKGFWDGVCGRTGMYAHD
jgi:rhamnosyltransferase